MTLAALALWFADMGVSMHEEAALTYHACHKVSRYGSPSVGTTQQAWIAIVACIEGMPVSH